MAIVKKTERKDMSDADRLKKIGELEKAILELRGEGRKDKVKSLKKTIAMLRTPKAGPARAPAQSKAPAAPSAKTVKKD